MKCKIMDEYLTTTLNKLKSGNYGALTIVIGNESCDLDSAVSALVYALFLHWQHQHMKCKVCTKSHRDESTYKDDIFVPVLNVDREDYELKTEVCYFLRQHGIADDQLLLRNDVNLKNLVTEKAARVVLVDHHALCHADQFLAPYVTEIIDHRPIDKNTWNYADDTRSTIEIVGSCCTLVAKRIREVNALMSNSVEFFADLPKCGDMLHSTIILDTINFSKEFNKATPLDEEVVAYLEALDKPENCDIERKRKLECLTNAKKDVSNLTAAQLLRKDVKVFGDILVPSFPILVKDFFQRDHVGDDLMAALERRNCHVAVLLGMDLTAGMERDAAIYAKETELANKLAAFLESWKQPSFLLIREPPTPPAQHYYKQNNVNATRKQFIPAFNEFVNNKQ